MPMEAITSSPTNTHKSIEDAVEFINSKIKKHNDKIQHHSEKLKHYRQIKDTLDGEVRWRNNNRASITSNGATPIPKKVVFLHKRKMPVKEEVQETGTSVKKGQGRKKATLGSESDRSDAEVQPFIPGTSADDS
mmetsp:Transcript_2171/g.3328  ORF Transcript_2171/g.3328 Transcript_2171/m.3328 type:complete len:134 (+) Transcript_2171:48-449(+)